MVHQNEAIRWSTKWILWNDPCKSMKSGTEKIEIISRAPIRNKEDLSLAYTPGVARPCLEIQKDEEKSFELTRRANIVAVVTDGTAVLGLGDIGPAAAMPVMEGKCALFKDVWRGRRFSNLY